MNSAASPWTNPTRTKRTSLHMWGQPPRLSAERRLGIPGNTPQPALE